ncbi:MAG: alanine racemase [Proteobacteria bacterium]|nr:alanine racemase [Pseudomonadota bacterium]
MAIDVGTGQNRRAGKPWQPLVDGDTIAGMVISELDTPALILDRGRLLRNIQFMSERAQAGGVDLRPHLKTAKSARVAELATQGHSGGITVSTLAEAAYFLDHGFADLIYAVCVVPAKLDRVRALQKRGARLTLLTDNTRVARAIAERARVLDTSFAVLIEIDSGEHRTGIAWDSPDLLDIADVLVRDSHVQLAGVLTHGGHSYAATSIAEVKQIAEEERHAVVAAAERLRKAGFPCATVSAGSTPTAVHASSFDGLTEIRPGVYTFFDLDQMALNSCQVQDIAISVLATVISHQPEHSRIVIDAGALALSKDVSANAVLPDTGYGWVCDAHTNQRIGNLHVAVADQEHGYVEGSDIPYHTLPIGSLVRVLPNHACITAAAHDRYAVIESVASEDVEPAVVDWWDRVNGWKVE